MAQPEAITNCTSTNLEKLPADQTDPMDIVVTRQVVESILAKYDPALKLVDFTPSLGSNIGDNYMAIMYTVEATVNNTKDNTTETMYLMLKTMPLNEMRQQMVNQCAAFVKEAKMYGEVFTSFTEFQKSCGFKQDELYSDFPKCYATLVDGKADYLAMENLRMSGYKMASRYDGLDRNHCTLVMKSLAQFHALSYAKYHGDYEKLLKAYPEFVEKMFVPVEELQDMNKMFIDASMKNNIQTLRANGDEKEASILESDIFALNTVMQRMHDLIGKPSKYAVIGHGDLWTNNMLFKYDSITGNPIEIKLVDFQLARICSRTIDLQYFLIGCPEDDLVNGAEDEFLRIYYNEFASYAKKLRFFEEELTFEQLKEEFDHHKFYGIIMGLMVMQFFFANAKDVKDMETMSATEFNEDCAKEFLGGMSNSVVLRKIRNVINVHIPRLK